MGWIAWVLGAKGAADKPEEAWAAVALVATAALMGAAVGSLAMWAAKAVNRN